MTTTQNFTIGARVTWTENSSSHSDAQTYTVSEILDDGGILIAAPNGDEWIAQAAELTALAR